MLLFPSFSISASLFHRGRPHNSLLIITIAKITQPPVTTVKSLCRSEFCESVPRPQHKNASRVWVCELCANAHGKGYASRQTITLEWDCGLGFWVLIKDIPRPRGFRILYTQYSREHSIRTHLERILKFSYKVNIKTRYRALRLRRIQKKRRRKTPDCFPKHKA